MDNARLIEQAWPDWEVSERIGEGSFGTVYKVQRRDIVGVSCAAVKVATIPQEAGELESLRAEGMTPAQSRTYLEGLVRDVSAEIRLMQSVKGFTNIVTIEDYKVIAHEHQLCWNILIRMELLKPLNQRILESPMSESDVIRLGQDICSALIVCRRKNIIHRDIKPENIFVNDQGDYKLGDFGVARDLDRLTVGITRKGTYNFMAPEVFNETLVDADIDAAARVDIYSLGLVLYRLSNSGRLPFLPDKQLPTPEDRRSAIVRRMRGDPLPAPKNASGGLAQVILKACAYRPEERFDSAQDMLRALKGLEEAPVRPKKRHRWRGLLAAALIVLIVAASILGIQRRSSVPVEAAPTAAPWPTNSDALLVCIYNDTAQQNGADKALTGAVWQMANCKVGEVRNATMAKSEQYAIYYLDNPVEGAKYADGIFVFPYEGVDYDELLARAMEKGVAVHLFASEEAEEVHREVETLYHE